MNITTEKGEVQIKAGEVQWKILENDLPYVFCRISTCALYGVKRNPTKKGVRFTLAYSRHSVFDHSVRGVFWSNDEEEVLKHANEHKQMRLDEVLALADVTVQFT